MAYTIRGSATQTGFLSISERRTLGKSLVVLATYEDEPADDGCICGKLRR